MTLTSSATDHAAIQKQNLYRVVYIALCGMILFTAYCSIQSLVSELYRQIGFGSLGRVCMLLYFGFLSFFSIVAPFYIKKISAKTGLVLGALSYGNFILAGLLTTLCSKYEMTGGFCSNGFLFLYNLLAGILVGVGGAVFWLCQATYVNACADESTKGTFNGLFWSVFQLCQITSSTLATLILSVADQFTFFSILTIFCVISVIMLFYIKDPIPFEENVQVEESPAETQTMKESLVEFYESLKDVRYYNLFSGLFFSGLAIGTYIAFLGSAVTFIVDSDDMNAVNKSIGFVFMVLAVGEVSAGFSVGKMADMYSKYKVFTATMYVNEAALLFTFLAVLFGSYKCAIICAFLWGYGDTAIQTMINTQIGFIYNGKSVLFSAYRFFQGAGIMFALLVSILIPASMPLFYVILMGGFIWISHYYYRIYMPDENQPTKRVSLLSKSANTLIELDAL